MTTAGTGPDAIDRLERELDRNFVIEASAGTGKTTSLVRRLIATVRAGADIRRVVAVTFTDRAASELKLRVRAELVRAAANEPTHAKRFEEAVAHLEEASLSTIHRFASDLLRRYALVLGLDPDVRVATQLEVRSLREDAFRAVTSDLLQRGDPRIERAFARSDMTLARLRRASGALLDYRSFRGGYTKRRLPDELDPHAIAKRISGFVEAGKKRAPRDQVSLLVSRFEAFARRFDLGTLDDFDLDAHLVALAREQKTLKPPRASSRPDADEALRDLLLALLPRYAEASSAELARELQSALDPVIDVYTDAKRARGLVDFDDLLFFARDLLIRDARVRAAVREHYTHIFVDEFQDTDRIQAELLMLIASDAEPSEDAEPLTLPPKPGKLLIVGDPKQSIYRFRNADPATYDAVRSHVLAHAGELLVLSTSWRSTPAILSFVNRVFSRAMTEDAETHQPSYAALAPQRPALGEQPGIIALPIPEPYGKSRLSKAAITASLPNAVADFIVWLSSSPLRVQDRVTGQLRPIEPRDIAILFRQVADFGESRTTPFSVALSSRGIPHIVIGGHSVAERGEAHALIVALRVIESPRDRLLVYATLKGLLFGIPDDVLLSWQRRYGPLHPLRLPITAIPERLCIVRDALLLLAELHRKRNERSAAETFQALLEATQAEVAIALTATPAQGFLQVQSLFQRAFEHDRSGGISFRAFARELADPSAFESASFDDLDDDVSGVKLLTVHRAKGLEFPVVILGDPETNRDREPERVMIAERGIAAIDLAGQKPWDLLEGAASERARASAESVRCAYVAATRARDLLVVPFVGDELAFPDAGWLTALTSGVLEAPRTQVDAYGFTGDDVVLNRPPANDRAWVFKPGLYTVAAGEQALVVDPKHIKRAAVGSEGISALELIAKSQDGHESTAHRAAMEGHFCDNERARLVSAKPLCLVETATARSHREPEARAVVESLTVSPRARNVGGKRFGTLVHGVLAYVPLDAEPAIVEAFARSLGGLCDATEEEVTEAIVVVQRVLASDVFARARTAVQVYRELPVTYVESDGTIIDGIIDLALELEDCVAVYDFKTDDQNRLTAEHRERYEAQVTLYANALARQFQKPITRALLFV